jgi:hypothetical protein
MIAVEISTELQVSEALDLLERALAEKGGQEIDRGPSYIAFGKFRRRIFGRNLSPELKSGVIEIRRSPSGLIVSFDLEFDHVVLVLFGALLFFSSFLARGWHSHSLVDILVLGGLWFVMLLMPPAAGRRAMRKFIERTLAPRASASNPMWSLPGSSTDPRPSAQQGSGGAES